MERKKENPLEVNEIWGFCQQKTNSPYGDLERFLALRLYS